MKYDLKTYGPEPSRFRRVAVIVLLAITFLLLVYAIVWYFWFRDSNDHPKQPAPATAPAQPTQVEPPKKPHSDKYYFAGQPRATTNYPNPLLILTNSGYVVAYDEKRKDPAWVCYKLHKLDNFHAPPRPTKFSVDVRTSARVKPEDYTDSGFDRGHMAPNRAIGLCCGVEAQRETFLMSNVIPQRPELNRGLWEKLEDAEIEQYAQKWGEVWVIVGPVFDPGGSGVQLHSGVVVSVPRACFKIMVTESKGDIQMLAFEMSQDVKGHQIMDFTTTVERVELDTGLRFFPEM